VVAPNISNSTPKNLVTNLGSTISWHPNNTGGSVTHYSISPSLPSGLSFNTSNGTISGIPTVAKVFGLYWRINQDQQLNWLIQLLLLHFLQHLYLGSTISWHPNNTGGSVTHYSISPSLPSELSFNTSNGTISGIPTVANTT
jgi:hypothetical protein